MRNMFRIITAAAICLAPAAAASAQDRPAFVEGFGGMNVASGPFGGLSNSSFGGTLGLDLTPNIQVIGEVGRMSNVLPSTLQTIIEFAPVDFRMSAWYGQGGVRLSAGSGLRVQPYVETIAGMARLRTSMSGLGAADPFVNAGLAFLTTTRPLASVGGGIVFQRGAVMVDAGYRFNRIFANESITGAVAGGDIDGHQLRAGLGVRF